MFSSTENEVRYSLIWSSIPSRITTRETVRYHTVLLSMYYLRSYLDYPFPNYLIPIYLTQAFEVFLSRSLTLFCFMIYAECSTSVRDSAKFGNFSSAHSILWVEYHCRPSVKTQNVYYTSQIRLRASYCARMHDTHDYRFHFSLYHYILNRFSTTSRRDLFSSGQRNRTNEYRSKLYGTLQFIRPWKSARRK